MELVDIVNDWDDVVGVCEREDLGRLAFNYRVVHVFVFNSQNELMVCERPYIKTFPGLKTSSAGGLVQAGECYRDAAYRELLEELGVKIPLEHVLKLESSGEAGNKTFVDLWKGRCDSGFKIDAGEIAGYEFLPLDLIARKVKESPGKYVGHFRELLSAYTKGL